MILETLRMAASGFRSNKLRAFLSLLGIVIGVASVVAVTAIAESGTSDLKKQFDKFSLDSVTVYPGWDSKGPLVEFTPALIGEITRVPHVKGVLRKAFISGQIQAGTRIFDGQTQVVESRYFETMGAQIALGRAFDAVDEYSRRPLAVVGADAALSLFPEGHPLGKTLFLTIDQTVVPLQIIGVLAPKEGLFGDDWNRSLFLPFAFVTGKLYGSFPAQTLTVVADSKEEALGLSPALAQFFQAKTGRPDGAQVVAPQEWAKNNAQVTGTIGLILSGIAGISLLVGGIGVMNIMLVSVTERKREIGIRKALGATPRHIRLQFLMESILLTLAGGLLGLGLGYLAAWIAVAAFAWVFQASAATALLAFGVSVGTGVFFGLYPAIRASRLDPVEALAAE